MPKWDTREPSKKAPPASREVAPVGGRGPEEGSAVPAVAPPWPGAVRPSVEARAAAVAREAEAAAAVAGRARRPARRGEGVISGQEAEAGSRWGGGGSHAAPKGGRGQRPGRAPRTAGFGPDPGLRPTRVPAPASASALHSRARRLPPQLPSAPSPRDLCRPKLGEKFPNFRQAGRSAPDAVPRLPAFPLGPQFRQPGGRRA